jgi:nucleoside-diphosphate-sugar epimerase
MRIFLTGGSGFIGVAICKYFNTLDISLKQLSRQSYENLCNIKPIKLTPFIASTEGQNILDGISGCDAVIHLAAKVHDTRPTGNKSFEKLLEDYRKVNVDGTINLARMCIHAGVKRFVYISSIKVNGESTTPNNPFRRESPPRPIGPYAISKYEAEIGLLEIAKNSDLEVVIIRPPLVYGVGVKANFMSLLKLISCNLPIPLGALSKNLRSFVALDNLINLIHIVLNHKNAKNDIFLVSDGNDLSTVDLLVKIYSAMGKKQKILNVPLFLLELCFGVIGCRAKLRRLKENLQVNIDYTIDVLGWRPVDSMNHTLKVLLKNV